MPLDTRQPKFDKSKLPSRHMVNLGASVSDFCLISVQKASKTRLKFFSR